MGFCRMKNAEQRSFATKSDGQTNSLRHLFSHLACIQPISMDKNQLSEWSSTILFSKRISSVLSPDYPPRPEGGGVSVRLRRRIGIL